MSDGAGRVSASVSGGRYLGAFEARRARRATIPEGLFQRALQGRAGLSL